MDGIAQNIVSVETLIASYGGQIFSSGLYRVFTPEQQQQALAYLRLALPEQAEALTPFASDWLGRIFALRKAEQTVVLAEPGTAELLDIPVSLPAFHQEELTQHADAALAEPFFQTWQKAGNPAPSAEQCVSYRKPLFLGGADTIENLELSDMDVYWTIIGQVIQKLRAAQTA